MVNSAGDLGLLRAGGAQGMNPFDLFSSSLSTGHQLTTASYRSIEQSRSHFWFSSWKPTKTWQTRNAGSQIYQSIYLVRQAWCDTQTLGTFDGVRESVSYEVELTLEERIVQQKKLRSIVQQHGFYLIRIFILINKAPNPLKFCCQELYAGTSRSNPAK